MTSSTKDVRKLLLIVPCYNEEDNIPLFVQETEKQLSGYEWNILFINDGSQDKSWEILSALAKKNERIHGICFARNFGHQNALKAGLEKAASDFPADAYVMLDADLQHPISLIPEMLGHLNGDTHIVQTQRIDSNRKISAFKKLTSSVFYGIFSWLSGIRLQAGTSDFRVIDRHTLDFITGSREKDLFLRGLLSWSGLRTAMLPYTPSERIHGTSRYTLKKMIALSLSGIVGYSARPLYLSILLGMFSIVLALVYFIYVIVVSVCGFPIEVGWPSVIATILALGGVQLFIIGIVGVYLGKLFMELKGRPAYVIDRQTK